METKAEIVGTDQQWWRVRCRWCWRCGYDRWTVCLWSWGRWPADECHSRPPGHPLDALRTKETRNADNLWQLKCVCRVSDWQGYNRLRYCVSYMKMTVMSAIKAILSDKWPQGNMESEIVRKNLNCFVTLLNQQTITRTSCMSPESISLLWWHPKH